MNDYQRNFDKGLSEALGFDVAQLDRNADAFMTAPVERALDFAPVSCRFCGREYAEGEMGKVEIERECVADCPRYDSNQLYSNCCGAETTAIDHFETGGRCPECKDRCRLEGADNE